jgi:GAF domain-containing protein
MNELDFSCQSVEAGRRVSPLLLAEKVTAAWEVLTSQLQRILPAGTGVGVSLIDTQATSTSIAATATVVLAADDAQYRLNEGPCLTAWAERCIVRVDDLRAEHRWSDWAAAALPLSIRSVVSAPLLAAGQALGSVKVYSSSPRPLGDRTACLLSNLADTAALLLVHGSLHRERELSTGLRQALQDRATMQAATVIVMGRYRISAEAASQLLMTEARVSGRPMREVAKTVVAATRGRD